MKTKPFGFRKKKKIMRFWKNKKIFITGATGFIGSWLTLRLIEEGASVFFLDYEEKKRSVLKEHSKPFSLECVKGSLKDKKLLEEIFFKKNFDFVFHLGAQTQVTKALEDPVETYEVNTLGTVYLLEACRKHLKNIQGIIIASSDKAYGSHDDLSLEESCYMKPEFPYDVSKACVEWISASYYKTYQLPIVLTRCGNVYGGGDFNLLRLIPYTISSLLKNKPISLRSDGSCVRDYIFVEDVVQGYMQLARAMTEQKILGECFNFGACQPHSVLEVVNKISTLMNKKETQIQLLSQAHNEISYQKLNPSKAFKILGWKARFSFDLGLKSTIEWYSNDFKACEKKLCLSTQ